MAKAQIHTKDHKVQPKINWANQKQPQQPRPITTNLIPNQNVSTRGLRPFRHHRRENLRCYRTAPHRQHHAHAPAPPFTSVPPLLAEESIPRFQSKTLPSTLETTTLRSNIKSSESVINTSRPHPKTLNTRESRENTGTLTPSLPSHEKPEPQTPTPADPQTTRRLIERGHICRRRRA